MIVLHAPHLLIPLITRWGPKFPLSTPRIRKSWRELKYLFWDRYPIFPEPTYFVWPTAVCITSSVQICISKPDKYGASICLCIYSCPHTRPELTLLQYAPFGTAMWLVCRDWRWAVLVCGITQPLQPSSSSLFSLHLGASGRRHKAFSSSAGFRYLQPLLLAAILLPCQNVPRPHPNYFSCLGVL